MEIGISRADLFYLYLYGAAWVMLAAAVVVALFGLLRARE